MDGVYGPCGVLVFRNADDWTIKKKVSRHGSLRRLCILPWIVPIFAETPNVLRRSCSSEIRLVLFDA